jgi:hypothetical protein
MRERQVGLDGRVIRSRYLGRACASQTFDQTVELGFGSRDQFCDTLPASIRFSILPQSQEQPNPHRRFAYLEEVAEPFALARAFGGVSGFVDIDA